MKSDITYIRHILGAIERIEIFIGSMAYEDFKTDLKTQSAVIRELEIIGEASNNLSEEFINMHPEFPLQEIISMRNKLIHEYFGVKVDVVWETYKDDLPLLRKMIEPLLNTAS